VLLPTRPTFVNSKINEPFEDEIQSQDWGLVLNGQKIK
jgi:hypothetical protein